MRLEVAEGDAQGLGLVPAQHEAVQLLPDPRGGSDRRRRHVRDPIQQDGVLGQAPADRLQRGRRAPASPPQGAAEHFPLVREQRFEDGALAPRSREAQRRLELEVQSASQIPEGQEPLTLGQAGEDRVDELQPGMIVTVEPGAYLRDQGMGCRIEDTVLVTATGHEVLSKDVPSTPDAIEALMKQSGVIDLPVGLPR